MTALAGTRVLDLTHMLSGPYAALMLADLGADTIKVEPPGGEPTRRLLADDPDHGAGGVGAYFLALNRNKQSVVIDLKSPRGQALFHELAAASDVVLYNFGAGVAERLAITREHLAPTNPGVITCSITGFGETGPLADMAAFDMVAQAMAGGMTMTGRPGDPPTRAGLPIADLGSSLLAVVGVLAALHERARTGLGQHVDISMHDGQLSQLSYMATMHAMSGFVPERLGNAHPLHVPYDTYPAADGYLAVAVVFDPAWPALIEITGARELDVSENRTRTGRLANRARIDAALAERFRTRPRAHWIERLRAARIPCAPVLDVAEALAEPHVAAREMMVEVPVPGGGAVRAPGNPVKLSGAGGEPTVRQTPPRLGEHTDAILRELLGKTDDDIAALRAAGVVA